MIKVIRELNNNCFRFGDTVYLIGKRTLSPDEKPQIVKAVVQNQLNRGRNVGLDDKGGIWYFNKEDLNKLVFMSHLEAENALAERNNQ